MLKLKSVFVPVVWVLSLVVSNVTVAQSIPILSDPIKVREVELMSNRLQMGAAQQEALLEVYDRYLLDFARVRSGEIKEFEDGIAEAAETFGFMQFEIPERELVEGLIRKAERAIRAIHQSDTLFFEEVSGMLTESQRVDLKRIELARELQAYEMIALEMLGELNRGARVNIRSLFESLNAESSIEIDEVLDIYDKRYLKEAKGGFDSVIVTVRLLLDQIDDLNIRGLDQQALMMRFMADPEAIEDLKRRGEILLKPLVNQVYEISQLNWNTWKRLHVLLSEEDAYRLQQWYFGKSFRDAVRGGTKVEDYFNVAVGLNSISESKKIDLQELQKVFRSKWTSMSETHAEVIERSRQNQTVAIMAGDAKSGFEERLDALQQNRTEYVDKTISRIESILGKELVAQLEGDSKKKNSKVSSGSFESSGGSVKVSSDANATEVQVVVGTTDGKELTPEEIKELKKSGAIQSVEYKDENGEWVESKESIEVKKVDSAYGEETNQKATLQGGATVPKPIPPSFPERSSLVLGLDESGATIIEAVYSEYRERYDEIYQETADTSVLISNDSSLSHAQKIRKITDLSKNAAEGVAELDTFLFDDLVTVTSLEREDKNVKMLENHRNRQRDSAPDDPRGWRGGEGDTIDLVGLYVMSKDSDELLQGISEESVSAIRTAMQKYHADIESQHTDFVEATYTLAHLQDAMWLLEEHESQTRMSESVQRRWREAFVGVRDTKRALLLANQNAMDSLLKEIPEKDFWKIRMEFVQKAYPDVFRKGADMSTMISAASAIPTLDATQKSKLESIASSYRYDYWDLCEEMIANHQSNASAASSEGYMDKEDIHRQLRLETLRFNRKELNDRMQMRLRMVLDEEQIKEVPGLRPTVSKGQDWRWQ